MPELVVQRAFGERLFLDYMGDFLFLVSALLNTIRTPLLDHKEDFIIYTIVF